MTDKMHLSEIKVPSEVIAYEKGYIALDSGQILGPYGKELKLYSSSSTYLMFGINVGLNKRKNVLVHRYVAYYFLGEKALSAECIRHKDSNKINNNIKNLLPGSISENFKDNPPTWRKSFASLGAATRRKLTDEQVSQIKIKLRAGASFKSLKEEYAVAQGTIQQIKQGKSYSWIQ